MIRPYEREDRDALWTLKRAFERELGELADDGKAERYEEKLTEKYRESYLDWVRRCLEDEPQAIQLAERDGEVVGYGFVLPDRLAHIWDGAVLNELYVSTRARGSGLADELFDAVLDVARAQNLPLDRVLLDVGPTNDRARAFYDRWGFEPWAEMFARPLGGQQPTRNH